MYGIMLKNSFSLEQKGSYLACADPENVLARGGSTLTTFFFCFFFMRAERIQRALKKGHDRRASETPLAW